MSCIFDVIVKDVLEIVIVYTRSSSVLNEIIKLYDRFNDKSIASRVKDKLTIKEQKDRLSHGFYMDNKLHREYDKPGIIHHDDGIVEMCWNSNNDFVRCFDLPTCVAQDSYREWEDIRKYYPTQLNEEDFVYVFNDNMAISVDGYRNYCDDSEPSWNILDGIC